MLRRRSTSIPPKKDVLWGTEMNHWYDEYGSILARSGSFQYGRFQTGYKILLISC